MREERNENELKAGELKKLLGNVPNNAEVILREKNKTDVQILEAFSEAERDDDGRKISKIVIVF